MDGIELQIESKTNSDILMGWFRKLLCKWNMHAWGEPKDFRGATHVEQCKYCPISKLIIRVRYEDKEDEVKGKE